MTEQFQVTQEFARYLDEHDPLARMAERYYVPAGVIYMDGNSLGLLSRDAEVAVQRVMNEWKDLAINGWTGAERPWFWYGEYLGELLTPLLGAEQGEVVVTNSTTTNIHNLIATFFKPVGKRTKIVVDELNFPTDHYAVQTQLQLRGLDPREHLIVVKSRDGKTIAEADVVQALTEEVALVFLPSVLYRSGQLLDIAYLTSEAHARGIVIGFDLAHSVGVVPHQLSAWDVDFALWCNYKYLNSGPGSTAGLYVNRKHFGTMPGLAGWWGHDKDTQFEMNSYYTPAKNAGAWQIGTVHMLSAAPLEGTLKIYAEVGIEAVREKSLKLTSYLMYLIDELISAEPYNYTIGTPREVARRGGHVAVEHVEEGYRINEALKARGVVGDFRPPCTIRIAPAPLYTSYQQVWQTVQHLKEIIDLKEYAQFSKNRGPVT